MRLVPLFNQLVVDTKEFFAPFILSQEVELLRTRCNFVKAKKVSINKDSLDM